MYPSEGDYLAEEANEAKFEAKLERIEDARIEAKIKEDEEQENLPF